MMEYSIKEFSGTLFYEQTLKELEANFDKNIEIAGLFANNIKVDKTPVTLYCPIENEEIEFAFPFAKKVKKLFYFIKGRYDSIMEIKKLINEIENLANNNLISPYFVKDATNQGLLNSRLGFMMMVAEKRIKLYEGKSLSANELALLIGVTNQGVVNKIRRGKLKAKKEGVRYRIKNEDVWEELENRNEENISDGGVPYYSYGKFKMQEGA